MDIDKSYFLKIENFLDTSECESIAKKFNDCLEINKDIMKEEGHRDHYYSLKDSDIFKKTSEKILKKFSTIIDKELLHTYTYVTYYEPGAILYEHIDRPANQYGLNINVQKESEWPIFLRHPESDEITRIDQNPGDAFIYKGSEVPHFRPRLKTGNSIQFMIFAVDKNSPFKKFAGDSQDVPWQDYDWPNKEQQLEKAKFYNQHSSKGIDINEEYLRSLGL